MENVNFMDNYYEDMIGGSFLNMIRQPQPQQPQPQPPQGPQPQPPQGPQSFWSKLSANTKAGIANAQTNINQGIQSTQVAADGIPPAVQNSLTNFQKRVGKGMKSAQGAAAGIAPTVQGSLTNVRQGMESAHGAIANSLD